MLAESYSGGGLQILDPVKDLRVMDMEFVEMRDECEQLKKMLGQFICTSCPLFTDHVRVT